MELAWGPTLRKSLIIKDLQKGGPQKNQEVFFGIFQALGTASAPQQEPCQHHKKEKCKKSLLPSLSSLRYSHDT